MITITVTSENGADARKELIDLLGLSKPTTWIGIDPAVPGKDISVKTTIESGEITKVEEITAEQPVAEEKKKRRTKAEIEAEKVEPAVISANTGSEEPPASESNVEEFPDLPTLQRACAFLVRAGYKQQAIEMVKTVGGAETSKDVPENKRQALIDALNKFAEENNVAQ